jgi:hypothetical protein
MNVILKAILLFGLNLLDAVLTLFWVRHDLATEGNVLMAHVLAFGELPFLFVKIVVGAIAFAVLFHWAHLKITRIGADLAVGIYLLLLGVHLITGIASVAR